MRLRNLFIVCLLLCLLPSAAYSAWFFGTGTQRVTLADNAALDLPNGEWTIAFRGQETSRTATSRFYSRNRSGSTHRIVINVGDGAQQNELYVEMRSASGADPGFPISDASPITSGNPFTIILSRGADGFVRLYLNNSLISTSTNALTTEINSSEILYIGNRDDNARPFNGSMADIAQWNRALTSAERAAYNAGAAARCFPGSMTLYLPAVGEYIEIKSGAAVTNTGATIVAHPRTILCGE